MQANNYCTDSQPAVLAHRVMAGEQLSDPVGGSLSE